MRWRQAQPLVAAGRCPVPRWADAPHRGHGCCVGEEEGGGVIKMAGSGRRGRTSLSRAGTAQRVPAACRMHTRHAARAATPRPPQLPRRRCITPHGCMAPLAIRRCGRGTTYTPAARAGARGAPLAPLDLKMRQLQSWTIQPARRAPCQSLTPPAFFTLQRRSLHKAAVSISCCCSAICVCARGFIHSSLSTARCHFTRCCWATAPLASPAARAPPPAAACGLACARS